MDLSLPSQTRAARTVWGAEGVAGGDWLCLEMDI